MLERLDLSQNRIAKVEGLDGLTRLRYLDLRANSIKVFDRCHVTLWT
jgi:Leucine-rich repeat (LRR) protein